MAGTAEVDREARRFSSATLVRAVWGFFFAGEGEVRG